MPLTKTEQEYILANFKTITVPEFAKKFKRGAATIYAFMKDNNIEWYRRPYSHPVNHPFRVQNRQIEQYYLIRKEVNAARHNEK